MREHAVDAYDLDTPAVQMPAHSARAATRVKEAAWQERVTKLASPWTCAAAADLKS